LYVGNLTNGEASRVCFNNFAELRSVCVAGLFGVYGGLKGLQVSQVQHATTCPFTFSIYFIVLVFSLSKVVTDCGILEDTNKRAELIFKT